jgi:hypothetical protein
MKIAKSTALLAGAFSLTATLAQAQFLDTLDLTFRDTKTFKMIGPNDSEYQGGEWFVRVFDGNATILGCAANNGFVYTPPNILCPSGTTGLVTSGDLDGDGVRDVGRYFSVSQPIPARNIEPFQTGLVELFSAPPSDLPRPLSGFNWVDNSTVIFYDLINDPVNGVGYELTDYESTRFYRADELERHRDEIVPGRYIFKFPALGSDEINPANFFMSAAHREMVEAFPGPGGRSVQSGGVFVGNDFRLTNDDRWNNGVMEFDPRIVFDFQWEGFNSQTFLAGDRVFFSVRDRVTRKILFPPIPEVLPPLPPNPELPQLIGSSDLGIPTGYELGPDFFGPNQRLLVEIEFVREQPVGDTADRSVRVFQWDIDLLDTYPGFVTDVFPLGSSDTVINAQADFDGDGFTNLEEFGLQTDPIDPASVPNPTPTLIGNDQCYLEIAKRPAVGSRLDYIIQYSLDLETWIDIEQGDPNWFVVFDNDERISVLSRESYNVNPCFLRVQFEQN